MYSLRYKACAWSTSGFRLSRRQYAESWTVRAKARGQEKQGERVRKEAVGRETRRWVIAFAAARALLVWDCGSVGERERERVVCERSVAQIVWRGWVARVERGRCRRIEARFMVVWAQDRFSSMLSSVNVLLFGAGLERR